MTPFRIAAAALFMLTSITLAQEKRVGPYDVLLRDEIKLPATGYQLDRPARFQLPALPAKSGLIPVLRARIFVDCPTPGGFNMNARVLVNGTPLLRKTAKRQERLLLRSTSFVLLWQGSAFHGQHYNVFAGDGLSIMFAPDAKAADAMSDDNLGGTFLLDLSDVVRGVDLNTLEIFGAGSIEVAKRADGTKGEGHIQDISVGYLDRALLPSVVKAVPKRTLPARHHESGGATLAAGPRGGFVFGFGGQQLCVETSVGMDAGMESELTLADKAAPTNAPAVKVKSGFWNKFVITAEWPSGLKLQRVLDLRPRQMLAWKETWSNASTNDLAVPFQNHFFFNGKPASITLGGNPDADFLATAPANPTLFMADEAAHVGFGWVAEDDWLRHLLQLSHDGASARVLSRNLALAPGKTIAFEMTLQAAPSPSYWDFINALRERWNVNRVLIEGPIFWTCKLPDKAGDGGWDGRAETRVATAVTNRGPLVAVVGPWLGQGDISEGVRLAVEHGQTPLTDDEVRKFYSFAHRDAQYREIKRQADEIHKAEPRARVMGMMHPSMDAAYKTKLSFYPFLDECILTRDGQPFEEIGYSRAWFGDMTNRGWGILYIAPHPHGRYQQELLDRIRHALDECNLDAIYSDEFTFDGGDQRNYSRYDYRQWDGYTVILDEDGKIVAKATDNGIASQATQLAMIGEVRKRGKMMLVNSSPGLRATQCTGIYHFVEGGNGFWWGANNHLTTPLVFGNVFQPKNPEELMTISRRLLETGNLHVPYSANLFIQGENNFIAKQHPITPQRVGPGFVIGRERIVTCKSGEFAWPAKPSATRIYSYDAKGNLLPDSPGRLKASSPIHLDVPQDGLVIVEVEQ